MLNFAYAEALELQSNFTEVHAVFEKFLEVLRKDLEVIEAKVNAASSSSSSLGSQADAPSTQAQNGMQSQSSSFNTQSSTDDKPPKNKELTDKRTDYGNVWIVYIRFARRAEGLQSARTLFGKARRDRLTPWEVHEAEGASLPSRCDLARFADASGAHSSHGVPLW